MATADQLIDKVDQREMPEVTPQTLLTEAKLLDAMEAAYNEGAEPSVMMCKPADSLILATFTASGEPGLRDNTTTLPVVDLYVSPFGEYRTVLNRHQMSTHLFLLDPQMWRTAVLRPFTRTALAVQGDSKRHMVVGEIGLMHKNPKGSAMVTGLS